MKKKPPKMVKEKEHRLEVLREAAGMICEGCKRYNVTGPNKVVILGWIHWLPKELGGWIRCEAGKIWDEMHAMAIDWQERRDDIG